MNVIGFRPNQSFVIFIGILFVITAQATHPEKIDSKITFQLAELIGSLQSGGNHDGCIDD
jgi:hypothetical protein